MKQLISLLLLTCIGIQGVAQTESINLAEGVSLEMVLVQGGSFQMGSNEGNKDNRPAHEVQLDDFYIGKFELTQDQWMALMGYNPSQIACGRCPVNDMSWEQLQDFLKNLNDKTSKKFRMTTEAEWEYAAQGGKLSKGYIYSGSNELAEVAWLDFNGNNQQHEVGQLKPNELGLYDMNGNAWELCEDWYSPKFYPGNQPKNPVNTKPAKYRVSRGGSWMSPSKYCFRWARNTDHPHHKRGNGGFRLVMEP
jgi:formylglycine-generating enzyme required for sulfatase activity